MRRQLRMPVSAISSARSSSASSNAYNAFIPQRIQLYRDGGTIRLEGILSKAVTASIRMDGKFGSRTQGQLFVSTKNFLLPASAERKMTTAELRGLEAAVKKYVRQTPGASSVYGLLQQRISAQLSPAPAFNPARVPTSLTGPNASAQVDASMWINLMPGPGVASRKANASVNVSGVGFNDAPPNFKVGSIRVFEQGTNKRVATVKNPKVVSTQTQWGQRTQTYRVEVPQSKLNLNKRYTFVLDTGINGAKPGLVRSDYVTVSQAH